MGSSALRAAADVVLAGAGPPAVADYFRRLIDTAAFRPRPRHDAGCSSGISRMDVSSRSRCEAATCW
jgi:hypothetical protein